MPRRGDRHRGGITEVDDRRDGLGGGIAAGIGDNEPASDAVNDVYDLLSASAIIGGSEEYIATTAVSKMYTLLTTVYP